MSARTASALPRIASMAGVVILIALAAQVAIPLYPVPMTMQTFAVLLAGAVLGPRWGVAAVVAYLILGLAGAPVFSDGSGGVRTATGPSGGYLLAFPAAAYLVGWAAESGWMRRIATGLGILFLAHLMILILGTIWLSVGVGLDTTGAIAVGFTPFLIGAGVKSILVLATVRLIDRLRR